MKSFTAKPEDITRKWFIVDASDQVLGRLASEIAHRLRGKHKAIFTPHMDTGDYIVVVNAEKVRLTGRKLDDKMYYWHTGYPGGIKSASARDRLNGRYPERVLEDAIRGMLPKNTLGRQMFRKLKVYQGPDHPHAAQQPESLNLQATK